MAWCASFEGALVREGTWVGVERRAVLGRRVRVLVGVTIAYNVVEGGVTPHRSSRRRP